MRSRTLSYNRGLGANLLKRCWPLWAVWFAFLVVVIPLSMSAYIADELKYSSVNAAANINYHILDLTLELLRYSAVVAPIAALLMFSYVFTSRGSGMIASLPIKRESVYITSYLTGLVPLLIAEVITALLTLAVCSDSGLLSTQNVLVWLYVMAAGTIAFYGLAVFCTMLTGTSAVMPVAYLLLGCAPYFATSVIETVIHSFVYGHSYNDRELFTNLSPIVKLGDIYIQRTPILADGVYKLGEAHLDELALIGWYCVAGLVLAVVGLLIFRKRRMEIAGDLISINILKPVFRYCMALGSAGVFAAVMDVLIFDNIFESTPKGIAICLSLVIGGAIGYYAAQMLIQKSVRVFGGGHKEIIIISAILLALGLSCEFDVLGYEKYVPESDAIVKVSLDYGGETPYTNAEDIEKLTQLHRQIIDNKSMNEDTQDRGWDYLNISYELKNGKKVKRSYSLATNVGDSELPNPDLVALSEVINTHEAIMYRAALPEGLTIEDAMSCQIYGNYINSKGESIDQSYNLTHEQMVDFYENCILPDAEDGKMLRLWPIRSEEYEQAFSLMRASYTFSTSENDYSTTDWKEFVIYTDAERCVEWIEENTNLKIQSIKDHDNTAEIFNLDK